MDIFETHHRKPMTYEFAIQTITLKGGKEIHKPVVRVKAKGLFKWIIPNMWERISIIYGQCITMDLPFEPDLTIAECSKHIEQYKEVLVQRFANDVADERSEHLQTVDF